MMYQWDGHLVLVMRSVAICARRRPLWRAHRACASLFLKERLLPLSGRKTNLNGSDQNRLLVFCKGRGRFPAEVPSLPCAVLLVLLACA